MFLKEFTPIISERLGLTKADTLNVIREVEVEIYNTLVKGINVNIHNVVAITKIARKPKKFHNVHKGEVEIKPARYKIRWRTAPKLDNALRDQTVYLGNH